MELPDVGRLLALAPDRIRALGERVRAAGLDPAFTARLARSGERLDDALRAPMRTWHARRMREPAAVAARVWMLHDPVAPDEARAALGELGPLVEAGLVEEGLDGLVSRLHLALAGDLLCFGDVPGLDRDAVMPICGATLELVRAATPPAPVDVALDLGCGAGPVALLLARAARRVVATDLSPRALAFTRFNATVNGVANVEAREGDLYAPVEGERFDRIAAHPPFVARPPGAAASTFVHGGDRGDELPMRVLAGAADHLSASGRAVVLGDWPLLDEGPLDARVRAAVGPRPVDALVLQSPPKNLDEYCTLLAAVEHRELGEPFARAAIAHRDHLEQMGLRGLALAFVVLAPGEGWTSLVPIRHVSDAPVAAETLDRLLAARRLALGPRDALAAARLRFPPGARVVEQPMPDGSPPSLVVHPPAGRPEQPAVLGHPLVPLVRHIAAADRVDDAVDAAREALLRGALEPQ